MVRMMIVDSNRLSADSRSSEGKPMFSCYRVVGVARYAFLMTVAWFMHVASVACGSKL